MHNLASNNKHSHGAEGSETSLLQTFAGQFSQSQLSAVKPKASWVVVMYTTRQMMIIAGGEPELSRRRHAKREGGVYAPPYALRVCKSCPECSVHVLCLCRKV